MNIFIFTILSIIYIITKCEDNVNIKKNDDIYKNLDNSAKINKNIVEQNEDLKKEKTDSNANVEDNKKNKKTLEKNNKNVENKNKNKDKTTAKKKKKSEETKKLIKDIKQHNKKEKEKENKNKKPRKTPSINKKILKVIKDRDKLLQDYYKNKKNIEEEKPEEIIKNNENLFIINNIIESKDITETFDNYLKKSNSKIIKQPYLKYFRVIKHIDFCQLDLFNLLLFLKNINKKNQHYYEVNMKLFNIFWGFRLTTGIDCGISFIKKNNNDNKTFFVNLSIGYNYCNNGHFEVIIGGSRINYNDIYYWPLWFAVTPINISTDIYKFKNSPISINLNIKLLFKGIITEDMCDFTGGFRNIDKNKILPYLGDMSNPNIFKTFVDLKIYLGFRYSDDK